LQNLEVGKTEANSIACLCSRYPAEK